MTIRRLIGRAWTPLSLAAASLGAMACFSEHAATGPEASVTCERAGLPPGPDTAFVIVRGFAFEPAELRVPRGTRIVWVNCEPAGTAGHTTTADAETWDSPTLVPGAVFAAKMEDPGAHPYACRPHPFMRGSVVVE